MRYAKKLLVPVIAVIAVAAVIAIFAVLPTVRSGVLAPTRAAGGDILPFTATETTLANGLKVIVVPTGFPNLVSIQIPVQVGSRNEVERIEQYHRDHADLNDDDFSLFNTPSLFRT